MSSTRKASAEVPSVLWHKSRTDHGAINTANREYRIHERTLQRCFEAYTPFGSFRSRSLDAVKLICDILMADNKRGKKTIWPLRGIPRLLQ